MVSPWRGGVEAAVQRLQLHKALGHTHLHTEHFKIWLQEAYPFGGGGPPPPQTGLVAEAGRDIPIHVAAQVDPKLNRAGNPSPDPKGKHKHLWGWPV